jgi:hypothetical protein
LLFGEHGVQVTTVDSTQAVVLKNVQVDEDIGANVEILAGLCLPFSTECGGVQHLSARTERFRSHIWR